VYRHHLLCDVIVIQIPIIIKCIVLSKIKTADRSFENVAQFRQIFGNDDNKSKPDSGGN
jgi:hypothetical protein